MPPITVMVKPVSGACNMQCRYCFYADEMQHRNARVYPRMTGELLDVMVQRVVQAADSFVHFIFQGGEPTLIGLPFFEQLMALERKYNTRGLRFFHAVQTNGYDLSDEMIAFLAREQFLVGVSLDGTNETHDTLRPDSQGLPTASVVRKNIDRLRAADVDVNVLCVINSEVARHPDAVFSALAPYEYLQFISCLDSLDGEKRDYSLSSEAYLTFLKATFDCYYRAYMQGRPVSVRNFDNWVAMLMGMPPENCAMVGRCGPSLVIESDGSVYPCDFYALDHWKLGSITENSWWQLLTSAKEKSFLEESLPVPSVCRSCKWYSMCRNGCKRERDPKTGINRWCSVHSAFLEYAYPRMREMARQLQSKSL